MRLHHLSVRLDPQALPLSPDILSLSPGTRWGKPASFFSAWLVCLLLYSLVGNGEVDTRRNSDLVSPLLADEKEHMC